MSDVVADRLRIYFLRDVMIAWRNPLPLGPIVYVRMTTKRALFANFTKKSRNIVTDKTTCFLSTGLNAFFYRPQLIRVLCLVFFF